AQAVLAPAISPAARVIMGEVVPDTAVGTVVLADRSPLPFGEIRAPTFPIGLTQPIFLQTDRFPGYDHFSFPPPQTRPFRTRRHRKFCARRLPVPGPTFF